MSRFANICTSVSTSKSMYMFLLLAVVFIQLSGGNSFTAYDISNQTQKTNYKETDSVSTTTITTEPNGLKQKYSENNVNSIEFTSSTLSKRLLASVINTYAKNDTTTIPSERFSVDKRGIRDQKTLVAEQELPKVLQAIAHEWPDCDRDLWNRTKKCGFKVDGHYPGFRLVVNRCVYGTTKHVEHQIAREKCKSFGTGVDLATPKSKTELMEMVQAFNFKERVYWLGYLPNRGDFFSSYRARDKQRIPFADQSFSAGVFYDELKTCTLAGPVFYWKLVPFKCSAKKAAYICDEISSYMDQSNITVMYVPGGVIFGDIFTLTVAYETLIDENFKIVVQGTDGTEIFSYSSKVGENKPTIGLRNGHPRESVETDPWVFDNKLKRRRCRASKIFHLNLLAREKYSNISVILYNDQGGSREIGRWNKPIKILVHHFPILIKPGEDRLVNGGSYLFTCVLRLGSDGNSSGVLGIVDLLKWDKHVEYSQGGVKSWLALFIYKSCSLMKGKGVKPEGLEIISVSCGYTLKMSGYHINVTFKISGNIGRFHLRRIVCVSNTDAGKQVHGKPIEDTIIEHDINVKFTPRTPILKIVSNQPEGVVIAGGKITAECSAFIGTVSYPQKIVWHISKNNDVWEVQYPLANNKKIKGVRFSGRPGTTPCFHKDSLVSNSTGKCMHFENHVLKTWDEAQQECEKYDNELMIIDNGKEFEQIRQKADIEGYWIGLNDKTTEGNYTWSDGREAYPKQWGYWSTPLEVNVSSSIHEKSDCVILQNNGLNDVDCQSKKRFICQSVADLPSPKNFDLYLGPIWTAVATINVDNFGRIEGAQLQCSTQPYTTIKKNETTLYSKKAAPFRYVYAPLRPRIEVASIKIFNLAYWINLTCSSVIASNGAITWIMTQDDSYTRIWILRGSADFSSTNRHSSIGVKVLVDNKNKDTGRFMKTTMSLKVEPAFNNSEITCFSYNVERPLYFGTNDGRNDLKATYHVNVKTFEKNDPVDDDKKTPDKKTPDKKNPDKKTPDKKNPDKKTPDENPPYWGCDDPNNLLIYQLLLAIVVVGILGIIFWFLLVCKRHAIREDFLWKSVILCLFVLIVSQLATFVICKRDDIAAYFTSFIRTDIA